MKKKNEELESTKDVFIGIDLHKRTWHVTVRTKEVELFSGSIPGCWEALRPVVDRYKGNRIQAVYEAGYFGFWLYDRLKEHGVECIVTPPSLLPQEYGNRVKTDRRDSRKLAHLLAKEMLKRVWVPSEEERYHRQVSRRRRQLIGNRVRNQNRIKAELRLYGIDIGGCERKWSKVYAENLRRIRFKNRWMQESFNRLLEEYAFLSEQIDKQTLLLKELSETELYHFLLEMTLLGPIIQAY